MIANGIYPWVWFKNYLKRAINRLAEDKSLPKDKVT